MNERIVCHCGKLIKCTLYVSSSWVHWIRRYVHTYVCIPIGDIVTKDQRDQLEYIHDVLGYNTDTISDVPWLLSDSY